MSQDYPSALSVSTVEQPMAMQPDVYVSPQAYLALEKQAVYKSEYIAGTIVAMSGASRKHNLTVTNIVSSLVQQLRGRPCEVLERKMPMLYIPCAGTSAIPVYGASALHSVGSLWVVTSRRIEPIF
jgi:Putative restriction endonuclease